MKKKCLGVMIDVSRNAVMNLETLKSYFILLKKMGYNCVFLYAEDTYEVEGEEYFGYMRGRYSISEMKEIDGYASSLGIEVIPCIQTLAHLTPLSKWGKYSMDTDDILMVDDDSTYKLIDRMFKTLSSCFATKRLHVGMDEAHMLGRGEHLDKYGYETVSELMKRHLRRVCEIADKYGYELMVWSDMFFRPWNDGKYELLSDKLTVPKEYIDALPSNVIPVYWNYGSGNYDAMFYNHAQLSKKTWFAGGALTWSGFAPLNRSSMMRFPDAIASCRRNKINNIFITMWGDDGAECSKFGVLPTLFAIAEHSRGNTDEELIKKKFKSKFGIEFDDFMLLDLPNEVALPKDSTAIVCPSKYMLYSDPFLGFLDVTVKLGEGKKYLEYSKKLSAASKKSRKYGYLFDTQSKLCDLLADKYELGVKTRAAYEKGDKAELLRLATEEYTRVEKNVKLLTKAFEKQWMKENKPQGFEVQHYRLGGLACRVAYCKKTLISYAKGNISSIPELEEKLLPFRKDSESIYYNDFKKTHTSNVV